MHKYLQLLHNDIFYSLITWDCRNNTLFLGFIPQAIKLAVISKIFFSNSLVF